MWEGKLRGNGLLNPQEMQRIGWLVDQKRLLYVFFSRAVDETKSLDLREQKAIIFS